MKQAMDETQQVYGELVMENAMKPDMLMKMQQAMMLPADTTLKSLFTPAEYDSIASPQEQLDTWFQAQAKQAGKKVGGLESMEQQIDVLYRSQSLQRQAHLLYCAATTIDYATLQAQRMTEAYMNQDLNTLLEIMEEKQNDSCDSTPQEEDTLIFGRNADWARQMPDIMKQAPTLFVVGAGHLPSQRGLLKLLEDQGYTIEPMK